MARYRHSVDPTAVTRTRPREEILPRGRHAWAGYVDCGYLPHPGPTRGAVKDGPTSPHRKGKAGRANPECTSRCGAAKLPIPTPPPTPHNPGAVSRSEVCRQRREVASRLRHVAM